MGESSKAPKICAAEKTDAEMHRTASVRRCVRYGPQLYSAFIVKSSSKHLDKCANVLDEFLKHTFLRFNSCFPLLYKTLGFHFDLFIQMCFVQIPLSPSSIPPLHLQFPSFPQQDPLLLSCDLLLYHLSICPSAIYLFMYLCIYHLCMY